MLAATTALGGLSLLLLFALNQRLRSRPLSSKSVGLIVLGDIGRSPRMLYHAQSFVNNDYTTYIIAYRGSTSPSSLTENELCHFIYLPQVMPWTSKLPRIGFLLLAPIKVLLGALALLVALLFRIREAPKFFFVQNPPSIPTLPIVQLAVLLRGSRLIIDWHNTGWSVLSLRLGANHPVVKIAKKIELWFGKTAFAHLMVTETMKSKLVEEAQLKGKAVAFHDRPPRHFRRQTTLEAHELFRRLPVLKTISFDSPARVEDGSTLFTTADGTLRPDRPALLVTSTSHTPDEDLNILLAALTSYELSASSQSLPKLVMLVTGKGPLKFTFEDAARQLSESGKLGQYVAVRTVWLELEDYPKLLGSSDVGISLHDSTSGMDLPMKVVDMFGCELPVLALRFECIGELVKDGVNGTTFGDAEELAKQLIDLLSGFPSSQGSSELERLRKGIKTASYGAQSQGDQKGSEGRGWSDWETHWDQIVLPLLTA
ncbi:chitobiosyldiphosphodolichol beta-1,4 mannosyltransferase [Sporobolomyces salmoneus]|uniref:chitobiosyldiphosphodolichol beta-1,4 mannosyltransferase n=1 Tax=Sporobolomyces salmoneus TaxID=183962 RepID=UPI0031712DCA